MSDTCENIPLSGTLEGVVAPTIVDADDAETATEETVETTVDTTAGGDNQDTLASGDAVSAFAGLTPEGGIAPNNGEFVEPTLSAGDTIQGIGEDGSISTVTITGADEGTGE